MTGQRGGHAYQNCISLTQILKIGCWCKATTLDGIREKLRRQMTKIIYTMLKSFNLFFVDIEADDPEI